MGVDLGVGEGGAAVGFGEDVDGGSVYAGTVGRIAAGVVVDMDTGVRVGSGRVGSAARVPVGLST